MKLLYIGNNLNRKDFNPTSVEFLGNKLKEDFQIDQISSIENIVWRLFHIWYVLLFKGKKYDRVLIDTYSTTAFHFAWTAAVICQWRDIPYIPILHGGNLPIRLVKSRKLFLNMLSKAFAVVSPSEYLKVSLNLSPEIEIQVIPNLLEIEKYNFLHRERIDKVNLIWLRAFDKIYNPELAIHLVDKLLKSGLNDVSLTMIGPDKDGSLENCKNLVRRLGLEQNVTFTGRLERGEWLPIAEKSNCFINTTTIDNFPVSLLEAMALGIPIISTNVGGIPFLIKEEVTGLLVPTDNVEKLMDAVMKLVNNQALSSKLSQNGRAKSLSYTWENVRKQWIVLLKLGKTQLG